MRKKILSPNSGFSVIKLKDLMKEINFVFENNVKHFDLSIYSFFLAENSEKYGKIIYKVTEATGYSETEIVGFGNYTKLLHARLSEVMDFARARNCTVMVDAEQSYLQPYIDYIAAFYFKIYNKDNCQLLNTLQCYLKLQQDHYNKWKAFARENELKFGIKLVRGAYMTEEAELSKSCGTINPVCEAIEMTHVNYDTTVNSFFADYKAGDKFIVATHNLESIKLLGENFKNFGKNENIVCAQLLGIAEHATGFCKQNVNFC